MCKNKVQSTAFSASSHPYIPETILIFFLMVTSLIKFGPALPSIFNLALTFFGWLFRGEKEFPDLSIFSTIVLTSSSSSESLLSKSTGSYAELLLSSSNS